MDTRTTYIILAFIMGWCKKWNLTTVERERIIDINYQDLFKANFMPLVEGKEKEQYNKNIAELFGVVITKVKTFPTSDGTWIILDKHTKKILHKNLKNENEVDLLCSKNNYIR